MSIDLSTYKPVPGTSGDANQVANGFQAIQDYVNGSLDHTSLTAAAGILVAQLAVDNILPWLVDIDVFQTAVSHVNWDTIVVDTAAVYNARKQNSGTQNDEINFDVVLAAGTWTLELMHRTGSSNGIYTVTTDDGVSWGTIDGYDAAGVANVRSRLTGVSITSSGRKRLKLKMATKNAGSLAYQGVINHIQLRRTA